MRTENKKYPYLWNHLDPTWNEAEKKNKTEKEWKKKKKKTGKKKRRNKQKKSDSVTVRYTLCTLYARISHKERKTKINIMDVSWNRVSLKIKYQDEGNQNILILVTWLGSLSKDDGDGCSKNVTKRPTRAVWNFIRPISSNLSNVREFS